ncbi:putative holin [Serratia fonticola]|uniref:putative holin n=1 Tax=Serratia fonticola TaxID=47917 RepID=UPI0039873E18
MTLPVSRATETAVVGGATFLGLLTGPDAADVFIGAFIGSVIFVISAKDYTFFVRVLLCLASFVVGVVSCDFFASLISAFLPGTVIATRMIGAIVSSAVSVRLLMALTQRASDPDILRRGPHE